MGYFSRLFALSLMLSMGFHICFCLTIKNPLRMIPECSHFSPDQTQASFYTTADGHNCCMCPMGTYLAADCRTGNPNSTNCVPCEYNDLKKTYVDFEPHNQVKCYTDSTACMSHMVAVGGSPTSKARCECPEGYKKVHIRCEKIVNPTSKVMQHTPSSTYSTEAFVYTSTAEMMKSTSIHSSTDTNVKEKDVYRQTTADEFSASSLAYFDQTSNSIDDQYANNNVVTGCQCNGKIAQTFGPPIATTAVYTPGVFMSVDSRSEEENSSILDVDDIAAAIESDSIEENVPLNNRAEAYNVDENNDVNAQPFNYYENRAIPPIQPQGEQLQRNEVADVQPRPLTELEKYQRYDVLMEIADEITLSHLSKVGHTLLRQRTQSLEDILGKPQSTHGKAMAIFKRSVQINPTLRLGEFRRIFENFKMNYLREIIDKKLCENGRAEV
uniref:uncharacterized protein LOC120332123 isoform X2 n=1 Tax=Styela clava TaxID=7725 RepID=UPI001939BAFA|nr:uncharacterized protein LOC120332123 isoform X2 [Styela clava]